VAILLLDGFATLRHDVSMNGQTETRPTSTERVNRHRAGLMTHVKALRADVAEIRRELAMLAETVRQPEQQQDQCHGRR
jgi:hypothetical protein